MTYSPRYQFALLSLAISFVCLSALGSVFLMHTWSPVSMELAIRRSEIFVALMVFIHAIGAVLYLGERGIGVPLDWMVPKPGPELDQALKVSAIQQIVIAILSGLLLDGGRIWTCCLIATMAHLMAFGWIALRRGETPSPWDLRLIRFGHLPLCYLVAYMASLVGR